MDDTFTELSKIFRNVTKLVREKTEGYFGNVTPLSRVMREVADEDNCSVPNSMLREVAAASNSIQNYHEIMQTVWSCLDSAPSQWRRIYKALCLLEYLVLLGPPRVQDDCRSGSMRLRNLTNFRYHDGLREQGGGVRQKALLIVEFIDDPGSVGPARQKAVEDAAKYVGIENKPIYDFHTPSATLPPGWGELGGAWRQEKSGQQDHPLPPNPYASMQRFQTAEDAARTWGIELPRDRNLGADTSSKYDNKATGIQDSVIGGIRKPSLETVKLDLPPDESIFGSAPDWWDGEGIREPNEAANSTGVTGSNDMSTLLNEPDSDPTQLISSASQPPKPPKPPVLTFNLLDEDQDSLI